VRVAGDSFDYWKLASFVLWLVFLGAGLAPEWAYYGLRAAAGVVTQRALVNSPYFITAGFAGYMSVFCLSKCRQAGLPSHVACGNAFQMGVIAFLAFLPFPLELLVQAHDIPVRQTRNFVYGLGIMKLAAWWYLWSLILYYHVSGKPAVFCRTIWLFPSLYSRNGRQVPGNPSPSSQESPRPSRQNPTGEEPRDESK